MTEKDKDEQLASLGLRAEEIRRGLDTNCTEEQLQRPLSRRMAHALIAATTAATAAKLTALAARVEQLEAGGVRYAGIWQRALPYRKGSVVTSSGSMWVALGDVPAGLQPGSDPAFWQLAEKGSSRLRKQKDDNDDDAPRGPYSN